jgi:hypothetical protein
MPIDQDKLGELLGTFVTDLGATIAAGNIVLGHRLGLYRALADAPATPDQLAQRTETDPRYVTGWRTLGARAGEAAIGRVAGQAGFTRFRRATETPFNTLCEARP